MNYTTLGTAVGVWTGRAGDTTITGNIATIVAMAEAKLNRVLRVREMVTVDAAFSIASEYVAVPDDLNAVLAFSLDDRKLMYVTPDQMDDLAQSGSDSGTPDYYTVTGENFRFHPAPSSTEAAALTYYAKLPGLEANSTNWLIEKHPDVYLYACCLEVELLKFDEAGMARFGGLLERTVADLNATESAVPGVLTPVPNIAI